MDRTSAPPQVKLSLLCCIPWKLDYRFQHFLNLSSWSLCIKENENSEFWTVYSNDFAGKIIAVFWGPVFLIKKKKTKIFFLSLTLVNPPPRSHSLYRQNLYLSHRETKDQVKWEAREVAIMVVSADCAIERRQKNIVDFFPYSYSMYEGNCQKRRIFLLGRSRAS